MDNPLLEPGPGGHAIGKNPLAAGVDALRAAGHARQGLAKVMRKKCLDCCGFQAAEVRKCVATDCPLWPYRMGASPFLSADAKARGAGPGEVGDA
jgi:hypothetical protein